MKDSLGFVHLKGLAKLGTSGSVIFVLPAGYRPAAQQIYPSVTNLTTPPARFDVFTNGEVKHMQGGTDYIALNISFRADA